MLPDYLDGLATAKLGGASWSTLDLVDLREELASLFGRPVDLIEEAPSAIPYRKTAILRDKSILYAH